MTDWSILGGNPAPGDPEAFSDVATALSPVVAMAHSSCDSVRAMGQQTDSAAWSGIAATAFGESIHAVPIELGELVDSHELAIRSLNDYSSELTALQQQANEVLEGALAAQSAANSASSRLAAAQARYSLENEQYWFYTAKIAALEAARDASDIAGDTAESSLLAQEVASAVGAQQTAWTSRSEAEMSIQGAQSDLDDAQSQLSDSQSSARALAAQRVQAAQSLAGRLSLAGEFSVQRRSWIDRVEKDLSSVAGFKLPVGLSEGAIFRMARDATGRTHTTGSLSWASTASREASASNSGTIVRSGVVNGQSVDGSVTAFERASISADATRSASLAHGAAGAATVGVEAIAGAQASGMVGTNNLGVGGQASVTSGAEATASTFGSIGPSGIQAGASGSAFVGDQAQLSVTDHIEGANVSATGAAQIGLGVSGHADAKVTASDVSLSLGGSAAVGLGLSGAVSVNVDPETVLDNAEDWL